MRSIPAVAAGGRSVGADLLMCAPSPSGMPTAVIRRLAAYSTMVYYVPVLQKAGRCSSALSLVVRMIATGFSRV